MFGYDTQNLITVMLMLTAITLIITVASEIFIHDWLKPQTLFAYLLLSSVITGVVGSIVAEKIDAKIFVS